MKTSQLMEEIDRQWYEHFGVPPPTLVPDQRHQRRLAFRNERNLYRRKCHASGKEFISIFAPDYAGFVYSPESWWGEQWDAKDFAREFSFERPFFEQFKELFLSVPQLGIVVVNSQNCEYNNFCTGGKDCYMCQRVGESENIYYSYLSIKCRDCAECYNINNCELCYEVIDGEHCYDVRYSQNVVNCRLSSFLFNCKNCSNCFLCANLRNSEYCFRNEKLSKAAYLQRVAQYQPLSHRQITESFFELRKMLTSLVVPHLWGDMNEEVSGNYIFQSRRVHQGFDIIAGEDVRYAWQHIYGNNCFDVDFTYHCNESYETASVTYSSNLKFCYGIFNSCRNLEYSMSCTNSCYDLFGCVGMKHVNHCILNQQYSEQEYGTMRARIVEHMTNTGEWGEYFPMNISPFAYNETVAHEYFPLTKEEVLQKGLRWKEWNRNKKTNKPLISNAETALPSEDICHQLLSCIECAAQYKIQQAEHRLYQQLKIPFSDRCPDCRYIRRKSQRNPRALFDRHCAHCTLPIQTAYAPGRAEQVICEVCYLSSQSM